jgi:lantibiotic modifying enzyme
MNVEKLAKDVVEDLFSSYRKILAHTLNKQVSISDVYSYSEYNKSISKRSYEKLESFYREVDFNLRTLGYSPESVSPPASDFHDDFQHVIKFTSHGEDFYYKNKSGTSNKLALSVIDLFKNQSSSALSVPTTKCYETFSIEKSVEYKFCQERKLEYLYRSLGHLIGLFYSLRGTDIHTGNIIFSEDKLFIIDTETLLTPISMKERSWNTSSTGVFVGIEDDEFSIRKIKPSILLLDSAMSYPDRNYIPQNGGRLTNPLDYSESIITGFREFSFFCIKKKNEIIDLIENLSSSEFRLLVRDTKPYYELIRKLTSPCIYGDYETAYKYSVGILNNSYASHEEIVKEEAKSLSWLNIPKFTHRPSSENLIINSKELTTDFILKSGKEATIEHLCALDSKGVTREVKHMRKMMNKAKSVQNLTSQSTRTQKICAGV